MKHSFALYRLDNILLKLQSSLGGITIENILEKNKVTPIGFVEYLKKKENIWELLSNDKLKEEIAKDEQLQLERETQSILGKLVKDGYAKLELVDDIGENYDPYAIVNTNHSEYSITFEGLVFLEQNGYTGKHRKEQSQIKRNNILNFFIAFSGTIAAIYYLLEIIKNYILPHCNCLFYAH